MIMNHVFCVACEGFILPDWAFLQERSYQLEMHPSICAPCKVAPLVVEYLGSRTFHVVRASMTHEPS